MSYFVNDLLQNPWCSSLAFLPIPYPLYPLPLPLSSPATQATFWARKLLLIDQKSALNYFWISIKAEKSNHYETVYVIGSLSGNVPFSSTTMSAPRAITARYFPRASTRGYLARRGRLAINTRGLESVKSLLVGKWRNLSLKGQTGSFLLNWTLGVFIQRISGHIWPAVADTLPAPIR